MNKGWNKAFVLCVVALKRRYLVNSNNHRFSSPLLNEKLHLLSRLSILVFLVLSACAPVAPASEPTAIPEIENTPTELIPSPIVEITAPPTVTAVPTPQPVYPYYLPLATKLEIPAQTVGNVTTQIDWVYVDEGRFAIQYTISGLDWPDGSTLDGMQQVQMTIPSLSDFKFGGFSGGMGGNGTAAQHGVITASSDQALLEGALDAKKTPNILVKVAIPVEGHSKVGTFHFNFTAPVLDGIKIENIDQTVVANNVSMTLKSVALNPSFIGALICFQMPSAVDWGLMPAKLTISGKEYPVTGGGIASPKGDPTSALTSPERCNDIGFDIAYDPSATSLTLTVPRLQASYNEVVTQEVVDRANQRLADKGIEFRYENVDHGGNIIILKRPEGAADPEIYPLIFDAMSDQYEGPWVFTIDIPK
jgi:hypothetical protein